MKHIKSAALIAALLLVCVATMANNKKTGSIEMTQKMFIEKVCNYKANTPPTWTYIGDKPCIIDFYTTWCGPCKRLAPVLNEIAKEYDGKIYIYKIDAERERELAALFGISSYPTLIFCPINSAPQIAKGALPKATLIDAIEKVLLNKPKKTTQTSPIKSSPDVPKVKQVKAK